jgi:cellulose synthase/poly-beta-1,6-N-acetylglucosamine synthase-like glycosyltransferase
LCGEEKGIDAMIIQVLSNLFEEGYVKRTQYSILSPFFAGANVAFRKKALDQVGLYDNRCLSGEDQDMTLRVAQAGWELFFEPTALVRHKNQMTVKSFARKWYDYGFHHPYIFKKHGKKGLYIFYTVNKNSRRTSGAPIYQTLIKTGFPFAVNIFLTTFLFMHLLAMIAIILAAIGLVYPAIITGVIAIILAIFYFKGDFGRRKISRSIAFIFLRYIANLALFLGGFRGGLKTGMLYVSPTFDFSI